MTQQKTKKTISLKTILTVIGLLVFFGVMLFFVLAAILPNENRVGDYLRRTLPVPIAIIGFHDIITTRELSLNTQSVRRFYETQDFSKYGIRIDFTTDDGKKRLLIRQKEILNKMLEDRMLAILAREKGIVVTQEAAGEGVRRKLEEYGGSEENVRANLQRLYGWSLTDFEEKVVIPNLYEERLTDVYKKESDTRSKAEQRIKEARDALRNGMSFEEVAKKYSEGRTREQGGELGWFSIEDLAKELQRPVMAQKIDSIGDSIESDLGFHIIVVEETKRENNKTFYRLKQIFSKKTTLADWLTDRMRASPPRILSREFVWDADQARVEFRSDEMKKFEQELIKKTEGNSLLLF